MMAALLYPRGRGVFGCVNINGWLKPKLFLHFTYCYFKLARYVADRMRFTRYKFF